MFSLIGVTGQVGGVTARLLLANGCDVRAVIRNPDKASMLLEQGYEVSLADLRDTQSLAQAFQKTEGVFVMLPMSCDPSTDFSEAHEIVSSLHDAIVTAQPGKVVCLSTIGAQVLQPSLLTQARYLEEALSKLPMPVAFVRSAWFMENALCDVEPARESGEIPSFLQPVGRMIPMVATADIGRVISETLMEEWDGLRIIELEGDRRISPNDIAETFDRLLGRQVRPKLVPRDEWEETFRAQGMKNPGPRMQMLDGFNEGWLKFEGRRTETRIGRVPLDVVLRDLVRNAG
ncbi:NmrA family NAD(P)-binding protein [Paraburkholderia sp. RL17-347-BIC-D]|uniref:NmrA family NAD(P)-binding protein n=1 Tax=Paraburkholderia sp. RL17-347-BIC-D TaxID=3031632 RepID=UPI0038BA1E63